MATEVKVTFEPAGRGVYVLPGTILLEAAARAGYIVETPCGGAGTCGKCVVRVTAGTCETCGREAKLLGPERVAQGYRLACQCRVAGDLTVEIPETSLFAGAQRILDEDAGGERHLQPTVTKRYLELDAPSRDDPRSDVERLTDAVGAREIDIEVLRALPAVLREGDFAVTAGLTDHRVVSLERGDTSGQCCGMAFDVGTTTLVGTLIDLNTGRDLAVVNRVNPQTSFGDDVVSRIKLCREEPDGLERLRGTVVEAVNELIQRAVEQAGLTPAAVSEIVFAGNATMQEILYGINPRSLGEMPFVPAFRRALHLRAADLGLCMQPGGEARVLPQIGGFVGGDTVAGIMATRLDRMEEPALLIDVGTNGELVLANRGRLVATSVAAGPAFEGARIVHGMRAVEGAIEKVVIDGDVRINVIGNARPTGLCGTGLVDAAAALLRVGVLDSTGRILAPGELPEAVAPALGPRLLCRDGQYDFVLADAGESGTGRPVCLHQRDVRELQLANGAIRAGTGILLKREGLAPSDLGAVLLAGAFGNFIRRKNALRVGMLPAVDRGRIRFVGNTASFGAKRFLLSAAEKEYADRIMAETDHVDLSLDPEFQMEFSAAMLFPED